MTQRTPHYRAFSVPEVLAVVAVIVIILSILLPSLGKSKVAARNVLCQNNLHQLHTAHIARNVDVKRQSVGMMSPMGWPGLLLPYVNNDNSNYICQEVVHSSENNVSNAANNHYLKVFSSYPGGYLYDMSMTAGPLCRQIDKTTSDATIDQLWSAYPSIGATIKSYRNALPEHSYLLCFEDLRPDGGDKDYEDVIFQLTEAPTGVTIKFLYDGAGYQFDLCDADGTVVMKQLDSGGVTKPGQEVTVEGATVSYGMTDQVVKRYYGGKNVIFMLDYQRSVAHCANTTGIDPWGDWLNPNGLERFARHYNKANVMFFDGGVRLTDPATIKPSIAQNRTDYWIP